MVLEFTNRQATEEEISLLELGQPPEAFEDTSLQDPLRNFTNAAIKGAIGIGLGVGDFFGADTTEVRSTLDANYPTRPGASEFLGNVSGSVGLAIPAVAVPSPLTIGLTSALFGTSVGGQVRSDVERTGKVFDEDRDPILGIPYVAIGAAIGSSALEMIGLGKLGRVVKNLPIEQLDLLGRAFSSKNITAAKEILSGIAVESGEEVGEQLLQNALVKLYDPSRGVFDQLGHAALGGAVGGGMLIGGASVYNSYTSKSRNPEIRNRTPQRPLGPAVQQALFDEVELNQLELPTIVEPEPTQGSLFGEVNIGTDNSFTGDVPITVDGITFERSSTLDSLEGEPLFNIAEQIERQDFPLLYFDPDAPSPQVQSGLQTETVVDEAIKTIEQPEAVTQREQVLTEREKAVAQAVQTVTDPQVLQETIAEVNNVANAKLARLGEKPLTTQEITGTTVVSKTSKSTPVEEKVTREVQKKAEEESKIIQLVDAFHLLKPLRVLIRQGAKKSDIQEILGPRFRQAFNIEGQGKIADLTKAYSLDRILEVVDEYDHRHADETLATEPKMVTSYDEIRRKQRPKKKEQKEKKVVESAQPTIGELESIKTEQKRRRKVKGKAEPKPKEEKKPEVVEPLDERTQLETELRNQGLSQEEVDDWRGSLEQRGYSNEEIVEAYKEALEPEAQPDHRPEDMVNEEDDVFYTGRGEQLGNVDGGNEYQVQDLNFEGNESLQYAYSAELLKDSGLVEDVVVHGEQQFNSKGEPVNGYLDSNFVLHLSPEVAPSTVGHEGFHAYVRLMGIHNPLVQQGMSMFHGDVEALADAVGDYYNASVMPTNVVGKVGRWLRTFWNQVRINFNIHVTQDVVAEALATGVKNFDRTQAVHSKYDVFNQIRENQSKAKSGNESAIKTLPKSITNMFAPEYQDDVREMVLTDVAERIKREKKTPSERDREVMKILQNPKRIALAFDKHNKGLGTTIAEDDAIVAYGNAQARIAMPAILQAAGDDPHLYQQYMQNLADMMSVPVGVRSDAGARLQRAQHIISEVGLVDTLGKLKRQLRPDELERLKRLAESGLIHDPRVIKDFEKSLGRPEKIELLWEYLYNSMLSSPATHIVNVTSNTLFLGMQIPERILAGGIDATLNILGRKERQIYTKEVLPLMAGFAEGVYVGLKKAGNVVMTGDAFEIESKLDLEIGRSGVEAMLRHPNPIVRAASPLVNLPSRLLRAMDIWGNTIAFHGQLRAIALRKGRQMVDNGELNSSELSQWVQNRVESLEDRGQASDYARHATFRDDPGPLTRSLIDFRERTPFKSGRLVLPFVNTLSNLLQRGIEYTPGLGIGKLALNRALKHEKNVQPLATLLARQVEGSIVTFWLMSMFMDEDDKRFTGRVPRTPAEREAFYRNGYLPYSIKIGDTWYQYRRVEPLNLPLSIVADAAQEIQNADDDVTATDLFMNAVGGVARTLVNNSFVENLNGVLETDSVKGGLIRSASRMSASLVPYSSFWRTVQRSVEVALEGKTTVKAKPTTTPELFKQEFEKASPPFIMHMLANTIPGIEETPARLNVWGDEVTLPGGVFRQWLPYKWSTQNYDKTEQLLESIERYPSMPHRTMKINGEDVEIPEGMYRDYLMHFGFTAKSALDRVAPRLLQVQNKTAREQAVASVLNRIRSRERSKVRGLMVRDLRSQ